jgi:periplasmic protein TonB
MKQLAIILIFTFFAFNNSFGQGPSKMIPVAEHYEGGQKVMYKFIEDNVIYPPTAKRNRMQGECIISFVLNEDGTTAGHKIVKNIGGGTGEEALRVVKLLKFRAPGYKMQTTVPVYFKL